jgi:hypothetical protein
MSALGRLARKPGNGAFATSLAAHKAVYGQAATSFVKGLDRAAVSDGARFAGYAPVLEAVATALAGVTNPATLDGAVQEAMQGKILQQLTDQILRREAGKLRDQLPSDIPALVKETLYGPAEQLARLGGVIYKQPAPLQVNELKPQFVAAYDAAVAGFMPNHPFLDGTGRQPSGAVFSAAINAHALLSSSADLVAAAERQAGHGPHTPNPFLVDFYLDNARQKWGDAPVIPPEHVVALYESVRARAAAGDIVRLTVEGEDSSDNADVEIQMNAAGVQDSSRRVLLQTSQAGVLRFGRQVNGVNVDAPQMDVVIGSGNSVELVAPVALNVARLTFDCSELVVLRGDSVSDSEDVSVTLEAKELLNSKVTGAPSVRKGAEFAVSWPGASAYPWSTFATISDGTNGGDVSDALRALRRLVLAFRSHSKGRLARYRDKIEHARMTKGGLGVALRERMVKDGILSLEGDMYFLDPSALGKLVGVTYQDLKLRRFGAKAREYVLIP